MSQCPWCLDHHETGLKLCPKCEEIAKESRRRWNEPIRIPKIKTNGEKPDD